MKFWLWWLYPFRRSTPQTHLIPAPAEQLQIEAAAPLIVTSGVPSDNQIEGAVVSEQALPPPAPPDEALPPSLPAPIERPLLQAPKYPEDWVRSRAMYFAPSTYSPAAAERILAPDLLFRLGIDNRRALVEAPSPTAPPPPAETAPVRERERRLMEDFATSAAMHGPPPDRSGCVLSVDPLLFTLFLCNREAGPDVPPEATTEYLAEPALLAHGIELRDRILRHWSSGGPPLTIDRLFNVAFEIARHTGTALLLSHNIAKAFARGGQAICWRLVNRTRGEYHDGKQTHTAAVLHRGGILKSGPLASPSLFFVLFSAGEFGTADAGAWYRYFLSAAIAYYAASGQARVPVLPPSSAAENIARQFIHISHGITDANLELTPAYRAWLWANAYMFYESATYGRPETAGRPDALPSRRGACFGIQQAGHELNSGWRWFVAVPGGQISTPFDLAAPNAHALAV